MTELYGLIDIGNNDSVGRRIKSIIIKSKSIALFSDPVTYDEAWYQAASGVSEWSDFLKDRSMMPGGLLERAIFKLSNNRMVAVAFIGLKNLDRPDGWRKGMIGLNGAVITLGIFPNKI